MLLTVDIGNTSVGLGIFNKDKVMHKWRLLNEKKRTIKQYETGIKKLFKAYKINESDIEGIILASVVPSLTSILQQALKFLKKKIIFIGNPDTKLDIKLKPSIKRRIVGHDILMNVVAGKNRFKNNFIVIDMGTATTFDVVDKKGIYIGSVIAPGVGLTCKALTDCCAQLPKFSAKPIKKIINNNTLNCMIAGIYFGYIGLLKEITKEIQKQHGKMTVCLTGGTSKHFVKKLDFVDTNAPYLTAEGLKLTWELNQ